MSQCSCCLCGGSCGASGSVVGLGHAAPSSLLDPEVPALWGSNTDSKPVEEFEIAQEPLHQDCHPDPITGGLKIFACARPKEAISAPTAGLPTPMQLKWCSSADIRKTSRLNPMGNKPTRRSRPSDAARSQKDSFLSPCSRSPPQVLQALGPLHQFSDVCAVVLFDSEPGEFLYVTSTYAGQPILELNETQTFEFRVYDHAYPLQTSSTASSRLGVNRLTGYMSLTGTNWVCGESITSTLHVIARAEGWGLQAMPPQPLQTVWLGNSSFWSRNLLTKDSGSPLLDPVHDAGITGSFFGPKPKELRKADHATRTALFHRALQVTVVYIPFNIHSNHCDYFKLNWQLTPSRFMTCFPLYCRPKWRTPNSFFTGWQSG